MRGALFRNPVPAALDITTHVASKPLCGASNIVFADSMFDPCSSGCPLSDRSPSVVALNIGHGVYLDLFPLNPADPLSYVHACAQPVSRLLGLAVLAPACPACPHPTTD